MKKSIILLALSAMGLGAQTAPDAASSQNGKPVLVIGSEKITAAQFDAIVNALPAQYQAQAKANKRQFADQFVQLKVLAAEAEKKKLEQQPNVQQQLAFARLSILASDMFTDLAQNLKIDDATVQAYYNDHKSEYEVVKAHHILIHMKGAPGPAPSGKPELSDEEALAKAKELKAKIAGGASFEDVARSDSDDSSAPRGGDLGEFGKGMMVPPFEQAAFAAKVGDVSDPVRSPFGYHLIRVDTHTTKPLTEVRASIEAKLRPDLARKQMEDMGKAASVTFDDSYFGPAQAPSATK